MAVVDVFPDLVDVDLDRLQAAVGARSYTRGQEYARGRVLKLDWDRGCETLSGRVAGRGEIYETAAYFEPDRSGAFDFLEGECSCPVGYNCKHVAAIVLAATRSATNVRRLPTASKPTVAQPKRPGWEQSLQALLASAAAGADAGGGTPMAIGVTLTAAPGRTAELQARPMRAGKRGWVNDNLAWSGLDSWQVRQGALDPDHVRLLREVYALHQATESSRRSYYSSYADRTIDLARLDTVVWTLLDEAAELGVPLLYGAPAEGEIELSDHAEVRIDVTGDGRGGLRVAPTLAVAGSEAAAPDELAVLGFLGERGHGVVYTDRAALEIAGDPQLCRWRLARLTTPAPPALRDVAQAWAPIQVPAAATDRFSGDIWPRLRHLVPVVSSDDSFVPPTIEGPALVLDAHHGAGHRLDLTWGWSYTIDGSPCGARLTDDPSSAGYRDPLAEQALIGALDVDLARYGLVGPSGVIPKVSLTGLDTMRFTTEALPWIRDLPDVRVEETGEPVDFREVGDSLVIGIATDEVAGERDWFDLGISITVEGRELPFAEVFTALAAGASHLLLDDGAYFSLEKPTLQGLRGLIDEARALQDAPPGELRISRFQAGLWDELRQLGVVDRQAEAWERQVTGLLELDAIETAEVPASVTARLRPYQTEGFSWLSFLWRHRLGGILADDMGLGKTLQSLAMISHARQCEPDLAPFLIVAPTSVVPNWAAEAARFVPGLEVRTVGDTLARSGRSIDEVVAGAHVVVTSYTLFRLDFDAYQTVGWSGLVLDEAQQVKNHNAKTHGRARELSTPFKLAITGTPMENSLMELWALLSITAPGLFPRPDRFAERYVKPIERQGDVELLAQLRRRIRPLVRRRTKEMVAADLPPKQEHILEVDLSPAHRKIYQTHLQRERQKVLGLLDDFDRNRFTILRSLTLLRQLSLHPALDGSASDGKAGNAHAKVPSAKIESLVEHLGEVIDGGHRALVFSQFTRFLGLVRDRLDREGIEHCYLDGKTRRRDTVLRTFKQGSAPVFLISLKAGGVGLNLTEADYCFLLDPWWNPATEAQAVDRTHRIGQTRNVMVYRLIARGTIEEKVMALKERKAELFSGVMDDGELFGGGLDVEDVRALFS